jgi:hypothetical protein
MTGTRASEEILAERIRLVLAIGEVNGAHQRAQATASGAQIELMTLEDHGGPEATPAALAAARERVQDAELRLAETSDRITDLSDRLAALDRELAVADP